MQQPGAGGGADDMGQAGWRVGEGGLVTPAHSMHIYAGGPYAPVHMVQAYPPPMLLRYGAPGIPVASPVPLHPMQPGAEQAIDYPPDMMLGGFGVPHRMAMAPPPMLGPPGTPSAGRPQPMWHHHVAGPPHPGLPLHPQQLLAAPPQPMPGMVMGHAQGPAVDPTAIRYYMHPQPHLAGLPPPPPPPPEMLVKRGMTVQTLQPPQQARAATLMAQVPTMSIQSAPKRTVPKELEENVRRTIYVSYIDVSVTEEELATFFSSCGPVVDCRICGDPNSAMRFAFLEFSTVEAAQMALTRSGSVLAGWPLKVQPSKTAIVPVSKDLMPRSHEEVIRCSRTVYVASIDKHVDRSEVRAFFEQLCGPVARLRLLGDASHQTRIAFVEFVAAEGAKAALNCSGALLGALPVRVSPSKTPIRGEMRARGGRDRDRDRNAADGGGGDATSSGTGTGSGSGSRGPRSARLVTAVSHVSAATASAAAEHTPIAHLPLSEDVVLMHGDGTSVNPYGPAPSEKAADAAVAPVVAVGAAQPEAAVRPTAAVDSAGIEKEATGRGGAAALAVEDPSGPAAHLTAVANTAESPVVAASAESEGAGQDVRLAASMQALVLAEASIAHPVPAAT